MADLSTMFNQLGPAGGSILAGVQMGNEANAAQSEQAYRQAQMEKIMQDTAQAKVMNPLEVQAKQQTINADTLKAKAAEGEYHVKALSDMIPRLESTPEVARPAMFMDLAHQANIPLEQADVAHLQTMKPGEIVPYLTRIKEHAITQNEKYRAAIDAANINQDTHKYTADSSAAAQRYSADARANAAAAKNKGIGSIQDQVRSGKMSAEKAAVAMYGAAQFESDPDTKKQYLDMAGQFEQFAMNQRNAGAAGKVDVGAAANLPVQSLPPAMSEPASTPKEGSYGTNTGKLTVYEKGKWKFAPDAAEGTIVSSPNGDRFIRRNGQWGGFYGTSPAEAPAGNQRKPITAY